MLGRSGYQVTTAHTAEAALEAADRQGFDIVASDIGLPGMDGFEMMARLKEKFGLKGIALSGYGSAEDLSRAEQAGFVELLVKPVSIALLRSALERHI